MELLARPRSLLRRRLRALACVALTAFAAGAAVEATGALDGLERASIRTRFDVRGADRPDDLARMLDAHGFDRERHERVRGDLRRGLIGLAQNRLPASAVVEDVRPGDVADARGGVAPDLAELGRRALAAGAVAVVTLAAGAGSRWTQGAGVVKALHPFARLAGRHRTFLEVHLAKSRRAAARACSSVMPAEANSRSATALLNQPSSCGWTSPGLERTTSNMLLTFEFLTVAQP